MESTVITLSPSGGGSTTDVVSFEQAYGEYSSFRGRGRARRQARKMDRIAKRSERKVARQQVRTNKAMAKQSRRTQKQQARQSRKDVRATRGASRRALRKGPEPQYNEPQYEEQSVSPEESFAPESQYQEPQYEEQQYEEEQYQEEPQYEEEYPLPEMEEGYGEEEYTEDEYSFEGAVKKGVAKIAPQVTTTAKKIEWNKEYVALLGVSLGKLKTQLEKATTSTQFQDIGAKIELTESQIEKHTERIAELEDMFGDYSEASGGKNRRKRKAEISLAKRNARKERKYARSERRKAHKEKRAQKRLAKGQGDIPVEADLNPELSDQTIEIEPTENFGGPNATGGGTGLIAIDERNLADSPSIKSVNVASNFSGPSTIAGIDTKKVLIGVAVGVGIIIAIKLITKKAK